ADLTSEAAFLTSSATAAGCETYTEWLASTSTTVEPARLDISRWAGGGIIRSSVVTRYQLGLVRQAGSLIVSPRASTPHGPCEADITPASSGTTSPALEAATFS